MDEIAKVELRVDRALTSKQSGPFAEITTRRGDVYRVWLDFDGLPLIELADRLSALAASLDGQARTP